jgi:hydroxyacylglutathione hydrolase
MILGHFRLNPIEVNSFVFGCPETGEAALVDCGEWDTRIAEFARDNELRVSTVFVTHGHYDHVDGIAKAAAHFGAQVVGGIPKAGTRVVDRVVGSGDELEVGSMRARIVDTSGHTPVGLSLIFEGTVFSGDALFAGSVGGTSNDEDYQRQLENIRRELFPLPGDYVVHTGHGPSTTIAIERTFNPFFV